MAQVKTSKPLTYYVDSPSVRIFQEFAGESLDNLDQFEAWDIITVLSQAGSLANLNDGRRSISLMLYWHFRRASKYLMIAESA